MKIEELIKEIDPDYAKCIWCKKFKPLSELQKISHTKPLLIFHECKNTIECKKSWK